MPTATTTSLRDAVGRFLTWKVRDRGQSYFKSGAVEELDLHGANRVTARVLGGQIYDVELDFQPDGPALRVSCTCPYVDENLEPCKHIWAAMLAATAGGWLGDVRVDSRFNVSLGTGEGPGDDGAGGPGASDEPDGDRGDADGTKSASVHLPTPSQSLISAAKAWLNSQKPHARKPKPRTDQWRKALNAVNQAIKDDGDADVDVPSVEDMEIHYLVQVPESKGARELKIEVAWRKRRQNGLWGKIKTARLEPGMIERLPDPADREIIGVLLGAVGTQRSSDYDDYSYRYSGYTPSLPSGFTVSPLVQPLVLPAMCRSGRCRLQSDRDFAEEMPVLAWDDGPSWAFWMELRDDPEAGGYRLTGSLRRGDQRLRLHDPLLTCPGVLVHEGTIARLDDAHAFPWMVQLHTDGVVFVPAKRVEEMLAELTAQRHLPPLDLPETLRYETVQAAPRPRLRIHAKARSGRTVRLPADVSFDYAGAVVASTSAQARVYQAQPRRVIQRDRHAERQALEFLYRVGFRKPRPDPYGFRGQAASSELELPATRLGKALRTVIREGWHVEADGKLYRSAASFNIEVRSGVDWFELHGGASFDGTTVALPELLRAMARGDNLVQLGDGTVGVLPEEWLRKVGALAGLGDATDDHVRFKRTQVGVLDALLAAQPEAPVDEQFAQARAALRRFEGVAACAAPEGFIGELRPYQREGLGWLKFLQQMGFGGCLADDMGLGKTIQVLALLEERRQLRARLPVDDPARPPASLVVVPRSLVFNWRQEAGRFTPLLRVADYTNIGRGQSTDGFAHADLVLTTYGTLRRDITHLKDVRFDYVILDEAQAVKNASTESAKAVRLLRGDHRLAMTGTPVENRVADLGNLFGFLNPGMLGPASALKTLLAVSTPEEEPRAEARDEEAEEDDGDGGTEEGEARGAAGSRRDSSAAGASTQAEPVNGSAVLLGRLLRPFILRRTKQLVAKDLPAKVEQTIYCELAPAQRQLYDELREHYRKHLLGEVDKLGIDKTRFQVLEALLRLRQAACHVGLVDKTRTAEPSAKLSALEAQLAEVTAESHKALVFSQFTSLLAIVRQRLDAQGVTYEYLDGQTRDREARVERFQNDGACRLFLISLKAGGVGLNLTAADYVFILDPWWNPAVEAQAVDRTHRIGQTRQVFAYRLIARGTVEEKVLELQRSKRNLADAIITADNSVMADLKREDLELLLS